MTPLDAKPNRSELGIAVGHLRFTALVSAGCVEPVAVRRPVGNYRSGTRTSEAIQAVGYVNLLSC